MLPRSRRGRGKRTVKPSPAPPETTSAASDRAAEIREKITGMIREKLPELTKVYNDALEKEAETNDRKKEPQKETLSTEAKTKSSKA